MYDTYVNASQGEMEPYTHCFELSFLAVSVLKHKALISNAQAVDTCIYMYTHYDKSRIHMLCVCVQVQPVERGSG